MFLLYRIRYLLSGAVAVVLVVTIYRATQQPPLKIQPHYDQTTMALALSEPEPEPVPETPPPVEPPPPPPPPPEEPPVPAEAPPPPPPKPKPRKPEVKKVEPVKKAVPVKKAEPVKPTAPAPAVPAKAAEPAKPAAAKTQASNGAQESAYQQTLRGVLEESKRYPTGRQAAMERPQGSVEVWLEVDRNGKVLNSGIAKRASNMLLNRAALSSLQQISQVPPFPADAYAGQNSKRFSATFTYQAP